MWSGSSISKGASAVSGETTFWPDRLLVRLPLHFFTGVALDSSSQLGIAFGLGFLLAVFLTGGAEALVVLADLLVAASGALIVNANFLAAEGDSLLRAAEVVVVMPDVVVAAATEKPRTLWRFFK